MRREYAAGIIIYTPVMHNGLEERLYLILQYPKGYWDLVKGKCEPEEECLTTAHRELREETGLEALLDEGFEAKLNYSFTDSEGMHVYKEVSYFVGEASSLEVTLSHEHTAYQWLTYEQAIQQLTYQVAQRVLTEAEEFLKTNNNR